MRKSWIIIKEREGLVNQTEVVLQKISTLKGKLTGGPERISLRVIEELENRIDEPNTTLF